MKRLTFKPQFVKHVLDGSKTATIRASNHRLEVGDDVSFVTRNGKTPAFLVKAEDGFARAVITRCVCVAVEQAMQQVGENPARFGFDSMMQARGFYATSLKESKAVYIIEWEVGDKRLANSDDD